MNRTWHDSDIDRRTLDGKTIAILGYGIQGRAQALNLRDSGLRVIAGGREDGKGIPAAREDGFEAFPFAQAVRRADVVFLLTPDDTHARLLADVVNPALRPSSTLGFACGFSIRFGSVPLRDDVDVVMVAPKGPGRTLRERFLAGGGLPALVGVHQDVTGHALDVALAFAFGIGSGRVAVIESSFAEEADTDLFGEQAVLCGGIPKLMEEGFRTLVEAGYSPEAAYIECIWEAKAIIDLVFDRGIDGMLRGVSPTARYGGLTRGPRIADSHVKAEMKGILSEIRSGSFARELMSAGEGPEPSTYPALSETYLRLKSAFGR